VIYCNGFERSRAAVRRKQTVCLKIEIIRKLASSRSQREVVASYNIALSAIHDVRKRKDSLQLFMVSREMREGCF
jgi:hypothetical protein